MSEPAPGSDSFRINSKHGWTRATASSGVRARTHSQQAKPWNTGDRMVTTLQVRAQGHQLGRSWTTENTAPAVVVMAALVTARARQRTR